MSPTPPRPPSFTPTDDQRRAWGDQIAAVLQFMACMVGGGWAASFGDPAEGTPQALSAAGMAFAWMLSYAAAAQLGTLLAPVAAVLWVAQRVSGRAPDPRVEARQERWYNAAAVAIAVVTLACLSVVLSIGLWLFADDYALFPTMARFVAVAAVASLLTPRVRRVIDHVEFGGTPPP